MTKFSTLKKAFTDPNSDYLENSNSKYRSTVWDLIPISKAEENRLLQTEEARALYRELASAKEGSIQVLTESLLGFLKANSKSVASPGLSYEFIYTQILFSALEYVFTNSAEEMSGFVAKFDLLVRLDEDQTGLKAWLQEVLKNINDKPDLLRLYQRGAVLGVVILLQNSGQKAG